MPLPRCARAMIRPDGLAAQQAFRSDSGQPVIAAAPSLAYAGYSLGGIEGGALAALAQDYTRTALYVPRSEFTLLIDRLSMIMGRLREYLPQTTHDHGRRPSRGL